MPSYIRTNHDFIVNEYIKTGKRNKRDPFTHFGVNQQGFIFPMRTYLSLYPKNGDDVLMVKSLIKKEEKDGYILFDQYGTIIELSEDIPHQMMEFHQSWEQRHFNFKDQTIYKYVHTVLESILLLNISNLSQIEEK